MILTLEEVKSILYLDKDCDIETVKDYQALADNFVLEKTGYDFGGDLEVNPLAKQLGKLYLHTIKTSDREYNKDRDYTIGITSLIVDLQNIARRK